MSKFAVLDLEMCKIPYGTGADSTFGGQEIIQIGVVLLDENYNYVSEFCQYVKPEFGKVDAYITNLTGITQQHVDNASDLKTVVTSLLDWLPTDVVFVEWSVNDEVQLCSEIQLKDMQDEMYDVFFAEWTDCQQEFSHKLDTPRIYKLSEALSMANIYYDDGAHDALVDARNTAKLFQKIRTEEVFQLSPYLIR